MIKKNKLFILFLFIILLIICCVMPATDINNKNESKKCDNKNEIIVNGYNLLVSDQLEAAAVNYDIEKNSDASGIGTADNSLYGDVDDNGKVNIVDALLIARHCNGLAVDFFNADVADVDLNGKITIIDALIISNYYVGLITNLPFTDVFIRDNSLEKAVREEIGKPEGNITHQDIESIDYLNLYDKSVKYLDGLEHFKHLYNLDLSYNQIEDLSPLSSLTSIHILNLDSNNIKNIDPLKNISSLEFLNLSNNEITDFTPLHSLSLLNDLCISYMNLSNIDFLKNIQNLRSLSLYNTNIEDISTLSSLKELYSLNLSGNNISDIGPLSNLTSLESLDLYGNQIADITPLSSLTALTYLNLESNYISSVEPLRNLTALESLYINNNNITDVEPLKRLPLLDPQYYTNIIREGDYVGGNNDYAGINLGNTLEAPNEGEWGNVLKESYFDKIKDIGFKYVRIPVRWSNHALTDAPYTIDTVFMDRVKWAVDKCIDRNLIVILNIHHYLEIMENPDDHEARFLSFWDQIAEVFKNYNNNLYFEILNEPNSNLTPSKWNEFLNEAISQIRLSGGNNGVRKLIIGTAEWGGLNALNELVIPDDDNLIVTIHYYEPFQFTHQGAGWVEGADQWIGTRWTGTEKQQNAVKNDFDMAVRWAKEHGNVPLFLGEFGTVSSYNISDNIKWASFIAREAETRGIFWTYWMFGSIYNYNTNRWNLNFVEGLLPK